MTDPARSVPAGTFAREWLAVPLTALMLLALQFQTMPIRIQVQVLPVTVALALVSAPLLLQRLYRTPLLTAVMAFGAFAFLHGSIALVVDILTAAPMPRFVSWARQSAGLGAGIVTFLVLREGLTRVSERQFFRWMLLGAIPALVISLLNISWGVMGNAGAGAVVLSVREVIAPEGYNSPLRASGFANEPAGWATSLVLSVFPAILYYFGQKMTWWVLILTAAAIASFVWTFSTIGLLLVLGVLCVAVVTGPRRMTATAVLITFVMLFASVVVLFPGNQVLRHARVLLKGQTNISFNDRFYALVGPFQNFLTSWTSVGYGLGGVSTHFEEIVPHEIQAEIMGAQWENMPNLTIMTGRIFAETGAIGFTLFLVVLVVAWRQLLRLKRVARAPVDRNVVDVMRLGWIAVLMSMLISIGPYQTPFLWLYLAWIDARYDGQIQAAPSGDGVEGRP